ncbi:unnamed protein product, partial [Prorocentrum cordatum]
MAARVVRAAEGGRAARSAPKRPERPPRSARGVGEEEPLVWLRLGNLGTPGNLDSAALSGNLAAPRRPVAARGGDSRHRNGARAHGRRDRPISGDVRAGSKRGTMAMIF